jgi:hypothetical protein
MRTDELEVRMSAGSLLAQQLPWHRLLLAQQLPWHRLWSVQLTSECHAISCPTAASPRRRLHRAP